MDDVLKSMAVYGAGGAVLGFPVGSILWYIASAAKAAIPGLPNPMSMFVVGFGSVLAGGLMAGAAKLLKN